MPFVSNDPDFEAIIPAILNWEGGAKLVEHPRDPGGKTKYGISERFNGERIKALNTTISKLTEAQAREIYYRDYWLESEADTIHDQGLALIHFDAAVNHGVGAAKQMLAALPSKPRDFAGDGLNKALFNELSLHYLGQRQARYASDKNADVFLEGWVNRLTRLINAHVKLYYNPGRPLE